MRKWKKEKKKNLSRHFVPKWLFDRNRKLHWNYRLKSIEIYTEWNVQWMKIRKKKYNKKISNKTKNENEKYSKELWFIIVSLHIITSMTCRHGSTIIFFSPLRSKKFRWKKITSIKWKKSRESQKKRRRIKLEKEKEKNEKLTRKISFIEMSNVTRFLPFYSRSFHHFNYLFIFWYFRISFFVVVVHFFILPKHIDSNRSIIDWKSSQQLTRC